MKKNIVADQQDIPLNENHPLSRRQWLNRVSIPVLTVAGAGMIGMKATAPPNNEPADDKPDGARIYNIRDYGAKGDGKTLNTKAIQAAIDACYADKGGTVLVPAGDFLSGTLELKSNVTLHLSASGKLWGSPKRGDYTAGKGVPAGNGNIVFL